MTLALLEQPAPPATPGVALDPEARAKAIEILVRIIDAVDHEWLIRFVEHRVGDRRVIRLIRKWLKAGVMEDREVTRPEVGTPQGGVASPLLANIYLHYVFDLWAERWRRHHAQGNLILVRYADDIVAGFEHQADASGFKQSCGIGWRSLR
jgi:retron-type reverse transcriptase